MMKYNLPGVMSLSLSCNIQMVRSCKHESKDPSCLLSEVQAAGGVMLGIFSQHTLGPLIPTKNCLNTAAYL